MKHLLMLGLLLASTLVFAEDAKKPRQPRKDSARMIAEFDKDGDGKLNDEERAAAKEAMKKRRAERLKKYDKDGDGKLNDEEKAAMREDLKKNAPKTRRPKRSKAEIESQQRAFAEGMVKNYDKDGDGKLSVEELIAMQSAPRATAKDAPEKPAPKAKKCKCKEGCKADPDMKDSKCKEGCKCKKARGDNPEMKCDKDKKRCKDCPKKKKAKAENEE